METIYCKTKNDDVVAILKEKINKIYEKAPIIGRFLGIDGFAEPKKDENGYITFLEDFDVEKFVFQDFLILLDFEKSRYKRYKTMISHFSIKKLLLFTEKLGPMKGIDDFLQMYLDENEEEFYNPLCLSEDVKELYQWVYLNVSSFSSYTSFVEQNYSVTKSSYENDVCYVWMRKKND